MLGHYAKYLIAHGEKMSDISRMSIRCIDVLCSVYKEKDKNRLIEMASAMRVSQADKDGWAKWIKGVEKE